MRAATKTFNHALDAFTVHYAGIRDMLKFSPMAYLQRLQPSTRMNNRAKLNRYAIRDGVH